MHTTALFLTLALGLAASSPQVPGQPNVGDLITPKPPYIPVISRNEVRDDSGQVISSYQSADGTSFEQVDVLKPSHDPKKPKVIVQQGTYSYISPDGTPVQVSYIADEKGFRPVGTHILGEVPVVPDVQIVEPIVPAPGPQPVHVRAPVPPPVAEPLQGSFPPPPPVQAPAPLPVPPPAPLPVGFPTPAPTPLPVPVPAPVPVLTKSGLSAPPVYNIMPLSSISGAPFNSFSPIPYVSGIPLNGLQSTGAPGSTFISSPAFPSGYFRLS